MDVEKIMCRERVKVIILMILKFMLLILLFLIEFLVLIDFK